MSINYLLNNFRDGSGQISKNELQHVFDALEIKASDREVDAILKQMDVDGENNFIKLFKIRKYKKTKLTLIKVTVKYVSVNLEE